MKFALTQGGKTGRGNAHTILQGGPHIYVYKTPCWVVVVDNRNLANTNNGNSAHTAEKLAMAEER